MAIKMAIIGMGHMAGWHVNTIRQHIPDITIVGGYDIVEEAKNTARNKWLVKVYDSPQAIYDDPGVDLVLIATPNDTHKDYAIACLRAGKHVICEKPVTMDAAELEEVMAVAAQTDRLFSIHQNRRWDKDYLTIRKILEDGLLHNPYTIESRVQGSRPLYGWRAFAPNGGGLLLDWGVHLLDQMLDLVPYPVVSVQAHLHSLITTQVDDVFHVLLRFENGCTALINISTNCYIPLPRWHVSCENGTAVIDNWELTGRIVQLADPTVRDFEDAIVYTHAGPTRTMLPRPASTTKQTPLPTVTGHWSDYYRNIVDVLQNGAQPIVTPAQALRVMKVIDACFYSDRTGEAVAVEI